jgi:hypothetical protein
LQVDDKLGVNEDNIAEGIFEPWTCCDLRMLVFIEPMLDIA